MLMPHISAKYLSSVVSPYKIINEDLKNKNLQGNYNFDTKKEHRLYKFYGDELKKKLIRSGINDKFLRGKKVLEVCGGTGFLTYHLLSNFKIDSLTVTDIAENEINSAKKLIQENFPKRNIEWVLGDLNELIFEEKFDLIIGYSFLHHFHDIPGILSRFSNLLSNDGIVISLHEPTVNSIAIRAIKPLAYLISLFSPKTIVEYSRRKHAKNVPNKNLAYYTDIWLIEFNSFKKIALKCGFRKAFCNYWDLFLSVITDKLNLENSEKQFLSKKEKLFRKTAFIVDSIINKFLPSRFFGSIVIILKK